MNWLKAIAKALAPPAPKGRGPKPRSKGPPATGGKGGGPRVIGRGGFPRSVVGESHYQDALLRICGGYSKKGHRLQCQAILIAEPDNAHDSNAIRVEIAGELVGRLSRDDAAKYCKSLAALGGAGQPLLCEAKIIGGWKTNQHAAGDGHFGVVLDLPWPLKVAN